MTPTQEFKKLLESCQDTLDWSGSMHKFLREMIEALDKLKLVSDQKKQKRIYREAYRDFRYALRSARRINRSYGKAKGALEILKPLVGVELQKQMEAIEQRLKPAEAAVLDESSFFRGRLNDDLNALEARIVTNRLTPRDVDACTRKVRELLAEDRRSVGLVPFMIEVRNLQQLLEGLKRKVA